MSDMSELNEAELRVDVAFAAMKATQRTVADAMRVVEIFQAAVGTMRSLRLLVVNAALDLGMEAALIAAKEACVAQKVAEATYYEAALKASAKVAEAREAWTAKNGGAS